MRVLLDECVHEGFRHLIEGHDVATVRYAGFSGMLDRELIDAADGKYDVIVTCDRGFLEGLSLQGRSVSVVLLRARSNRLADLAPLAADLDCVLAQLGPGELQAIG